MRLGLYTDSHMAAGSVAKAAEDAGFGYLWLYDSPLVFGDTSMACVVAAQATTRIAIGPGVANPAQRPPEYTAQMLATLNTVAPGRTVLGLGVGNSARRSLGLPPVRLEELRTHLETVRQLLSGADVRMTSPSGERLVRFIQPHGRWINITDPIPLWMSAFGPAGQAVAAAVADGLIARWEGPDQAERLRARIRETAHDRPGGSEPRFGVVCAMQPIQDESELERPTIRAALGPLVVSRLRYLTANASSADDVPQQFRDGFVAYSAYRDRLDAQVRHLDNYRGYLVETPPDLESFVTPASMKTVALIGPPGRIAEELRAMAAAGVDHCGLQMAGDQPAWCERMASQVFPLLGISRQSGREGFVEVAA